MSKSTFDRRSGHRTLRQSLADQCREAETRLDLERTLREAPDDITTAAVLSAAETLIQQSQARECMSCRKEFVPTGTETYCNTCDEEWRIRHLPVLQAQALEETARASEELALQEAAEHQRRINNLLVTNRLCTRCHGAEKNGEHPLCSSCYEAYQATLADCKGGCGGKAGRGYDLCLTCKQEAEAKVRAALEAEINRYFEMKLRGTNGIPATKEFIRTHMVYFRQEFDRVMSTTRPTGKRRWPARS